MGCGTSSSNRTVIVPLAHPTLKLPADARWTAHFARLVSGKPSYPALHEANKAFLATVLVRGPPNELRWELWKTMARFESQPEAFSTAVAAGAGGRSVFDPMVTGD